MINSTEGVVHEPFWLDGIKSERMNSSSREKSACISVSVLLVWDWPRPRKAKRDGISRLAKGR